MKSHVIVDYVVKVGRSPAFSCLEKWILQPSKRKVEFYVIVTRESAEIEDINYLESIAVNLAKSDTGSSAWVDICDGGKDEAISRKLWPKGDE